MEPLAVPPHRIRYVIQGAARVVMDRAVIVRLLGQTMQRYVVGKP